MTSSWDISTSARGCLCTLLLAVVGCGSLDRSWTPESAQAEYYDPCRYVWIEVSELTEEERVQVEQLKRTIEVRNERDVVRTLGDATVLTHPPEGAFEREQRLLYALALLQVNRTSDAELCLLQVIEGDPRNWRALFHRWQLRQHVGDHDGASTDRARGMELNRGVFSAQYSWEGGVL